MKKLKISSLAASFILLLAACATTSSPEKTGPQEVDKEEVRQTVRKHIKEIALCYDATRERIPKLEGKVVIRFTINSQGYVTNLEANKEASTIADDRFINCMTSAIATWQFAVPPESLVTEINYPFLFRATDPEAEE